MHDEAITDTSLKDEFAVVGVGFAVDQPGVEFSCTSGDLFEGGLYRHLWFDGFCCGIAKGCVVPGGPGWIDPLWLSMLAGVFHDNAKSGFADHLFCRAEDPDAGLVHLDDDIGAFARTEKQGIDGLGCRDRVAVERNHPHLMAG